MGYFLPFPPECPLKVRVGLNSPSLCPTISSVQYTLTKLLPLWTRKVLPMNSGTTVQSRAHVRIGSLLPTLSCLAKSRASTYGPFLLDRLIHPAPGLGLSCYRHRASVQCQPSQFLP